MQLIPTRKYALVLCALSAVCVSAPFAIDFFVSRGLTNAKSSAEADDCFMLKNPCYPTAFWQESEEWRVVSGALKKDAPTILEVSAKTDTDPRLLAALVAVEQLRLFYSDRQFFKEIVKPLGRFLSQNQFSWGILGIKEKTARQIEQNLLSTTSFLYPGASFEHLLDMNIGKNPEEERFDRISDETNHYYSYLYAALYLKEISMQWQKAGYPIENQPAILATLYNIGFENSSPKTNPRVGGSEILIGTQMYSFGGFVHDFYYSDALREEFPEHQF